MYLSRAGTYVYICMYIIGMIMWDSNETLIDLPVAAQEPSFEWYEVRHPAVVSPRTGCSNDKNQILVSFVVTVRALLTHP